MTRAIPFNKLIHSPNNVRTRIDETADAQLSADIEAHGLLTNLLVTKSKKRGKYEVFGGGRRLRAIAMLVKAGSWNKATEIQCKVFEGDDTNQRELSTSENFQRLDMSPAEECKAFSYFAKQDGNTAEVAKRFGVTKRFVDGRIRLAGLADPIFKALDEGEITLDVAKAYATTSDTAQQLAVYEEFSGGYSGTNAQAIRRALVQAAIRGDSAIAKLVGVKAYEAAGGQIERDLFSDESEDHWINPEIAKELAAAMLETRAAELLAETGHSWIKPVGGSTSNQVRYDMDANWVHVPYKELTDEETARREEITTEIDTLSADYERAENDDAVKAIEAKHRKLSDEYDALDRQEAPISNALKAVTGRFLVIDTDGELVLESSLYSLEKLDVSLNDSGEADLALPASGDDANGAGGKPGSTSLCNKSEPTEPEGQGSNMSMSLFEELAVQRRDVLAAALAGDFGFAHDYAIFNLVYTGYNTGSTIRTGHPSDPVKRPDEASPARQRLAELDKQTNADWEDDDPATAFVNFCALDDEMKARLLAVATARTLEAQQGRQKFYAIHDTIGSLLDIDATTQWRPTAANYFGRIKKAATLAILKDIGGADFAARYASQKRADLAATAEKIFSGEAIIEPEVTDAAAKWLPRNMRFDSETEAEELPDEIETTANLDDIGDDDPDDTKSTDTTEDSAPAEEAPVDA